MQLHRLQLHIMSLQKLHRSAIEALMSTETSRVEEWRGLLATHARVHGALERALRPHDLGVSEYEVLERLAGEEFAEQRRMQDLGEALHLSQSALSRVVGRLEKEGLAQRGMCPEDRRGIVVCITPGGRERYEEARPAHRTALEEALA
jgi:DNA-binding MarR family transcriptional regulator